MKLFFTPSTLWLKEISACVQRVSAKFLRFLRETKQVEVEIEVEAKIKVEVEVEVENKVEKS